MTPIKIKQGFNLNAAGKPSADLEILEKPRQVAVLPERFMYVKPRLHVKEGDPVKLGDLLFEDKKSPKVKFLSPGGGRVLKISYGPRRVIQEIVIELNENEESVDFPTFSESEIESANRDELVAAILNGGMWPVIQSFPYRKIADPESIAPAIYVTLDSSAPFFPSSEIYLKNNIELFKYGIAVLKKLCAGKVFVLSQNDSPPKELSNIVTHFVAGGFPCNDPGIFLYYTRKEPGDNYSWYLHGQDLLLLASLLKYGKYPTERIMLRAGTSVRDPKHVQTQLGVPLSHLIENTNLDSKTRFICGGLLNGYAAKPDSFMGFYESSLSLIPDGSGEEFFAFARLGWQKPSHSRTFLSVFNPSPMKLDTGFHGDERACINCGYCMHVCPVEILPQILFKAIFAEEVEESFELGLLDCVECGLCSYVCPSKIELMQTFKAAKTKLYKEQSQ